MIAAHAYVLAGACGSAALALDDVAGADGFAAEFFDTEAFAFAIAAVF